MTKEVAHLFHQLLINEDRNAIYILSVAHQSLFWSSSFLHLKNTSISFKPKHTSILIWPSLLLHRAFTRCGSHYAMQGNPVHLHPIKQQQSISLLANEKQQTYFYYSQLSAQFVMEGESLPSVCTCEQGEHVHSMRSTDALNLGFQYVSTKPWMVGGITEYQWSHMRMSVMLMCDFPQWLPSNFYHHHGSLIFDNGSRVSIIGHFWCPWGSWKDYIRCPYNKQSISVWHSSRRRGMYVPFDDKHCWQNVECKQ